MLPSLGIPVPFGETEIHHVDAVGQRWTNTNQKVLRLQVPVNEIIGVHVLHPG